MANPYGMTEFDASGAINAMEAARSNRIRSMLLQRQIQREDAEAERQGGIRAALARYRGGDASTQAAPSASAPPAPPTALTPASTPAATELMGGSDASWAGATSSPAPAQDAPTGPDPRQQLFSELLALDPPTAFQVMQAFSEMDDATFEASQRRNGVLARAAQYLLTLPEDRRPAEFQRIAPTLISEGGVTRQQLAGFELTPDNLNFVISQARDVERLAEEARPRLRNVEGGEVIDENLIGTGRDPVVFRSEYIDTQNGLYRRPTAGTQPRELTDEEMRELEEGGPTRTGSGNF